MSEVIWGNVIKLAKKTGQMFLATADKRGVPHMSVVKDFIFGDENHINITGWFCPNTFANLTQNPNVSLVVWDPRDDSGYQLIGKKEKMEDLAMLDGYAAGLEGIPQVERKVSVHVQSILGFKRKPHIDLEVGTS